METIKYYKAVNPNLKVMISYQKNHEEWKNLYVKFKEYFGDKFGVVEWSDLD